LKKMGFFFLGGGLRILKQKPGKTQKNSSHDSRSMKKKITELPRSRYRRVGRGALLKCEPIGLGGQGVLVSWGEIKRGELVGEEGKRGGSKNQEGIQASKSEICRKRTVARGGKRRPKTESGGHPNFPDGTGGVRGKDPVGKQKHSVV